MKVQVGQIFMDKVTNQKKIYSNKTRRYLLPCLKEYGDVFMNKLNNVFKVAVGIGDIVVSNVGISHEKHIFILLSTNIAPTHFINFLQWVREQPMYEDDYVFNNIQKSTHHMVILRIPEKFYNSLESFKKGEYSKMYTPQTITAYFQSNPKVIKVLIRDHEYKIEFTERLNEMFGTKIKPEEYDGELALPPNEISEFFNHHLKK